MIAPLDITIDGLVFQSRPMKPTEVLKLDKTLLGIAAPTLGGLGKSAEGKLSIDFGKSAGGLAEMLMQLPDDQALAFYTKVLARTVWIGGEPHGVVELGSAKAIDLAFEGASVISIYKLIWEVLKHNKFSFFGLLDYGAAMVKMLGLPAQTKSAAETGTGSGSSET